MPQGRTVVRSFGGIPARFYSRDELVNDNYGLTEQTDRCHTANPEEGPALDACIRAITAAQFLVEPGAPAVSNMLTRARPDEDAASSMLGLAWFGSKGARYSTSYGDRRMPSTTISTDEADWKNASTSFDMNPADYQILFDWVAQGAKP